MGSLTPSAVKTFREKGARFIHALTCEEDMGKRKVKNSLPPAALEKKAQSKRTLLNTAKDRPERRSFLYGRSVIIGFQKTQIYQRFSGSRQEVFILKIQNDENNAAQQDNGRRFHIEIKQKQGQYFLLFLFDSIELLLHHSLQKHPRLLLQRYSDRSV